MPSLHLKNQTRLSLCILLHEISENQYLVEQYLQGYTSFSQTFGQLLNRGEDFLARKCSPGRMFNQLIFDKLGLNGTQLVNVFLQQ